MDPLVGLGQHVRMFDIVIGIVQYSSNILPFYNFCKADNDIRIKCKIC